VRGGGKKGWGAVWGVEFTEKSLVFSGKRGFLNRKIREGGGRVFWPGSDKCKQEAFFWTVLVYGTWKKGGPATGVVKKEGGEIKRPPEKTNHEKRENELSVIHDKSGVRCQYNLSKKKHNYYWEQIYIAK